MPDEPKQEHPVEYEMKISFNKDEATVKFTGETVEFFGNKVRPRHLRIVTEVHKLMREYIRDNSK